MNEITLNKIINLQSDPTIVKLVDESLYVVTVPGTIYKYNLVSSTWVSTVFLELEFDIVGLEFHPNFSTNGIFWLYYTTQSLNGKQHGLESNAWSNRETNYDHIDTLEEWRYKEGSASLRRTILKLYQPMCSNKHYNNLTYVNQTLILSLSDVGSNLSLAQDDDELLGKLISIDVSRLKRCNDETLEPVSRISQLQAIHGSCFRTLAKGIKESSNILVGSNNNHYLCNSNGIYKFNFNFENFKTLNFGWRPWSGAMPTMKTVPCKETELKPDHIVFWNVLTLLGDDSVIHINTGQSIYFVSSDDLSHTLVEADDNWNVYTNPSFNISKPSNPLKVKLSFGSPGIFYAMDILHSKNADMRLKIVVEDFITVSLLPPIIKSPNILDDNEDDEKTNESALNSENLRRERGANCFR